MICPICHIEFEPSKSNRFRAICCSQKCNLKRWRKENAEHNKEIKRNLRWKNGVLKRGTPEYIKQQSENSKGNKNKYIADRSKLSKHNERYDYAYVEWMKVVKKRDKNECQLKDDNCMGKIHVHHIYSWKYYKEKRYDVDNGICLCDKHHPRGKKAVDMINIFNDIINKKK